MEPIRGAVESLLAGLKARAKEGDPEQAVAESFSEEERRHVRFASLEKGRLRLAVDSSAWLYSFNLKRRALTASLAKKVPAIKEISFFIGKFQ